MSFSVIVALTALLIASTYIYLKYLFSYWKRRGIPFVEPSIPFGNFASIFNQSRSLGQILHDLYHSSDKRVLGCFTGFRPTLLIRDPMIVRDILIKDFQYFWHRGFHFDTSDDPMSQNLLALNGEKWKEMRAKLSPAFTSRKLKRMVETIVECGKKLEAHIDKYAATGKEVEVRELFAQFTTTVIATIGYGLDVDCLENPRHEFRKLGGKCFEPKAINGIRTLSSYFSPFLTKLFGVRFVDKAVGDFMIETVRQNLEYREQNNIVRKDFFQLLIQLRNTGKLQDDDNWDTKTSNKEKTLSLEDITAQAFIFFIAGFESTSTTMTFCLHELAKKPNVQQKVYEEIGSVLKRHNGKLDYEALSEMRLLECCIDETLRLHPPFDAFSRECTKDYKIADTDMVIEKGTLIFMSVTGPQYDSKYYDQPEEFIPERFMSDQNANKNSLNMPYLVFGDGPRNCVGMRLGKMETKIGVCMLLRKFSFELGAQHINQELVLDPKTVVRAPLNGIHLKFTTR